jgi:hypothetical protein
MRSTFTLLKQYKRFPRYNSLIEHVSPRHISHHSQWCVLSRKHAEILVRREDEYIPWFDKVWAPDETAYLTALLHYNQNSAYLIYGTGTTFTQWFDIHETYKFKDASDLLNHAHPKTYKAISLDELLYIRSLKQTAFARKFVKNCTVRGLGNVSIIEALKILKIM